MQSFNTNTSSNQERGDDRRRVDWQKNDRRKTWPWVSDSNDRRSGEDRRLLERRARETGNSGLALG